MNRLLFLYLTLAGALACAADGWSAALMAWTREIEAGGGLVIPVKVVTDPGGATMRFDGDVPFRSVVARYMADDHFRAQLVIAHALTLNYRGPEGELHFIIVNMARSAEWSGYVEGMLAHEIGHAWLDAKGYAGATYQSDADACLGTHATDIVQHVMIRSEMKRRQIDGADYWISKLSGLISGLETGSPPVVKGACQQALLLSQWMDARLGTAPEAWEKLRPIQEAFQKSYPELARAAADLETYVRDADLEDPLQYRSAMQAVKERVGQLSLVPPAGVAP